MNIKLFRNQEGADGAGTATLEAPETAAPEQVTPEPKAQEEAVASQEAPKPKVTDWDRYQKMQEKYSKRPNAVATKAEMELREKYEGKDESEIDGYPKSKSQPVEGDDEAQPAKAKDKEKPEESQESDPLEPVYKLVGAKDKTQLPEKIQGLVAEMKKLSGERGELGRVLKDAGVSDLKSLQAEIVGARRLHALVEDIKAGRQEAYNFLGIKPQQAQGEQAKAGELPEGILDDGLYNHLSPQLKAANERAERLERQLAELAGKITPWERSQQETMAANVRNAQVAAIITEAQAVADSVDGLWDSKTAGPLSKALNEYYSSKDGDPYNPALEPILGILAIAKEKNLPDLDTALAVWERKNSGSLIAKARADAREPFIGKRPNVGLSDRQGGNNGQFKTYTEASVKDMAQGRVPIPAEWTDAQGTIIPDKVPANLRELIFPEG